MSNLTNKFMKSSALNIVRTFRRNKDGVAAIEFALIAPILIFMYLGLLEVSLGIMADRDVSHATNVAGDLATQVDVLDGAELIDIYTAAVAVMAPRPNTASDIRMLIDSYRINPTTKVPENIGKAKLGSDITKGGANLQELQDMNLLTETSGVVVATINYDYTPVGFTYFEKDKKITLSETFVLKPRRSADIPMEDSAGARKDYSCTISNANVVACTAGAPPSVSS